MKFSVRNFLAFCIFLGLVALVSQQVHFTMREFPETRLSDAIIANLNPFWKLPTEEKNSEFPVKIPIVVENSTEKDVIPQGEVTLWNTNGTQISNIATINVSETSSGTLSDAILINPDKKILPAHETHNFEIFWQGFGDQYIDATSQLPVTEFQTLTNIFQNKDNYNVSFYEKAVLRKQIFLVTAKTKMNFVNPEDGSEVEKEMPDLALEIPYQTIEKTLNIGLVVNLGIILILALVLWKHLSTPIEQNISGQKISAQEIENLEAEATKLIEIAKAKQEKRQAKKSQKNQK